MQNNQQRVRFALWVVVALCLMVALMNMWTLVKEEATFVAFNVASKRIIEQANLLKQQHTTRSLELTVEDNSRVLYDNRGWLLPIYKGKRDCRYWLKTLYPQHHILGLTSPNIEDKSQLKQFYCRYIYAEQYQIDILLNEQGFTVKSNTQEVSLH